MMRKAAAVLAAICCLVASQANALGLGSLTLESSLNQPLRARIEIVDLGGVSPSEIVVSMGSQQDFQRFDLERTNFFSDVDFNVESTPQGIYVVLTSNQSVREPYLSFILDTRWPSGRILSEHTVLLDLPVFSDGRSIAEPINQPVSPVVEPEVEQQPENTLATVADNEVESELQADQAPEPVQETSQTVASEDESSAPQTALDGVEIQESDTLWEIAMRVRPDDSVSIQQTMLALQRLNPEAFVSGNINRLRAGETLRIPDLSQIQSVNQQQAVSEVTRQNQQANLNVQPLTAPASGPSSLASDDQQGQLRVLTSEPAEPASSNASAAVQAENAELDARIQALENQLALQEEEVDRARLQQADLVARLSDLDAQIVAAMEIINLQDQQLAQLQQSLAEAAQQSANMQQEQPGVEAAQQVVTPATESQLARTGQPRFLDSVTTVLNNNSMVLIVIGLLVVLLMVMLLMRRNRAVTGEGFEVGFEGDVESDAPEATISQRHAAGDAPGQIESGEVAGAAVASLTGEALAETDEQPGITEEVVEEFFEEPASEHTDFLDDSDAELEDVLDDEQESDLLEDPDAEQLEDAILYSEQAGPEGKTGESDADDETRSTDDDTGIDMAVFDTESVDEVSAEADQDIVDGDLEDPEGESDEEIVDFELDTEIESAEEDARSEDSVDFDIDEFLDEDETVEAQDGERPVETGDGSLDSEQGIDFELDTEVEEGQQGDEEDTGLEFDGVEFSGTEDSDIEHLEVDSDVDGDTESESGLDLDTFALEDDEAADESGTGESDQGEEIESLDFDLSQTGISEFESEEGSIDLEADADDSVETFDFDLGEIEADDGDQESDRSTVEAAESPESVDFELNTEAFSSDSNEVAEQPDEELEDLLEVEFEPETESALEIDKDRPAEAEANQLEEAEAELVEEAEADQVEEAESEQVEEIVEETSEPEQSEVKAQAESDAAIEFDAETVSDATEEESEPVAEEPPVIEDFVAEEAVEEAEEIEFTDDSSDENEKDTDEIAEVLAQDEEAATPDAEVELSDLDFLSSESDSELEGAEQDSELLSDDDEAATKLDLAYAYQKMGDFDGAKEILEEVLKEGNDAQVSEAKNLIETLQR